MDLNQSIDQLAGQADTIRNLVAGISEEQAHWKPDPDAWSILEVINHLYDEEREDFRLHLDYILHRPDYSWPGIDPQGWVKSRHYNQRELKLSLSNFLEERRHSLAWLDELSSPDWNTSCPAPFGQITAGDMLASWVAHDLLHMRQLIELRWAYTVYTVQPFKVEYAGRW
jgi:hypothetical protein